MKTHDMSGRCPRATGKERKERVTLVDSVPRAELRPGVDTAIVPGANLTLSFLRLSPGLDAKLHSHPEEQAVVVLEGALDLVVEQTTYHVRAGDVALIPGGIPHSAVTHGEACRVLDVFSPARKDFEEKLARAMAARS